MKLAFGKLWSYVALFVVYAIVFQAFGLWVAFGHVRPETDFQWRYFAAILIITLPGAAALTNETIRDAKTKRTRPPKQSCLKL